jgi:hypothetical protein
VTGRGYKKESLVIFCPRTVADYSDTVSTLGGAFVLFFVVSVDVEYSSLQDI